MIKLDTSIVGYIADDKLRILANFAKNSNHDIVEVGNLFGRSLVNMALNTTNTCHGFDPLKNLVNPLTTGSFNGILNDKTEKVYRYTGTGTEYDDLCHDALLHNIANIPNIKYYRISSPPVDFNITFKTDLIYIDGNHTGPGFKRDLHFWYPILDDNGFIIFDDFKTARVPLVTEVLKYFGHESYYVVHAQKCYVSKNPKNTYQIINNIDN